MTEEHNDKAKFAEDVKALDVRESLRAMLGYLPSVQHHQEAPWLCVKLPHGTTFHVMGETNDDDSRLFWTLLRSIANAALLHTLPEQPKRIDNPEHH